MAVAVAEVARHRVDRARLELAAEDVHTPSLAHRQSSVDRPSRNVPATGVRFGPDARGPEDDARLARRRRGRRCAVAGVTIAVEILDGFVPVLSLGVLYVFAVLLVAIFWGPAARGTRSPSRACSPSTSSSCRRSTRSRSPSAATGSRSPSTWSRRSSSAASRRATACAEPRPSSASARPPSWRTSRPTSCAVPARRGPRADRGAHRGRPRCLEGQDRARRASRASSKESPHPLTVEGRTIGVLFTPEDEEPVLGTQRRLLPALAALLGVALERDALAREAVEAETLRRSDIVKTAVIQAVSHDLRTPLATIEQALDGLESGELALTDDDRLALLETIRAEHGRLKRLVENLLDLSRLQARAIDARPELWTVDELVAQALDELDGADRVVVTTPSELPPVRVDAVQIQRALVNVIENALRLSPPGEPVSVRLTATRKDVLIRVTDRGPGIPESERERIFEPFHRVSRALGRARRGSRARDRARVHRGQRRPHVARIPRGPGGIVRDLAAARRASRRRHRMTRVLVVDDEPQFLRALQTNLRGAGYEVDTASDRRGGAELGGAPSAGGDHPRPDPARRPRDRRVPTSSASGPTRRSSSSPPSATRPRRSPPSTRAPTTT